MAKACVYLCRQCRFIDGFGEFGEIIASAHKTQAKFPMQKLLIAPT